MQVKEKAIKLFTNIKKSIKTFTITIIAIIIFTLIYSINIYNDFLSNELINKIFIFVTVFSCTTFLLETLFKEKSKFKVIGYLVATGIAFLFTYLIMEVNDGFFGMTYEIFQFRIIRTVICYLIVIFTLAIYFNYKNSEKGFGEYLANTFINVFKTSLIYAILALGVAAILEVFILLILDGSSYILILRFEILLLGIYYIPNLLYALHNQEKVEKFGKVVIKYVLDILVIAAFIVIYMYIIKIIILRDMPSNQIFRILATLFIIGMPIWTMTMAFDEKKLIDRINVKLPLLFIPFILMQIYSIGVRIISNGITPLRYLCVMLVIFELIYVVIYIKNREKAGNILIVFCILAVISLIFPCINMFYISDVNQYLRLKARYVGQSEFTKEDASIIYSAYSYLTDTSIEGAKYLINFTEDDISQIETLEDNISVTSTSTYRYLFASETQDYIDTDGYKTLYKLEEYDGDVNLELLDFSTFILNVRTSDEELQIQVDLYSLISSYIENRDQIDEYFKLNNEIELDEYRKIILENISLKYNYETNTVVYYQLSGYLLEK